MRTGLISHAATFARLHEHFSSVATAPGGAEDCGLDFQEYKIALGSLTGSYLLYSLYHVRRVIPSIHTSIYTTCL